MEGLIVISDSPIKRVRGSRMWEAGSEIGRGGQSVVYEAREILPGGDRSEDLMEALNVATAPVGEPPDIRRRTLARALKMFMAAQRPYEFALKLYSPREGEVPEVARTRFEEEVRVLTERLHPNVIHIEDNGVLANDQRFAMLPLFRRGNLEGHREIYVGDAGACLEAVEQILAALVAIHQRGLVHRDIKPANILIADDGRLVLADFGLVLDESRDVALTRTGHHVGNWQFGPDWGYIDPAHEHSKLMDLYAAGRVLWWLASGKPFLRREDWDTAEFNLMLQFPSKKEMGHLNEIFGRVLKPRPSEIAYTGAAEMLRDVRKRLSEVRTRRHPASRRPSSCHSCQTGTYVPARSAYLAELQRRVMADNAESKKQPHELVASFDVYRCDACGHLACYATHPTG